MIVVTGATGHVGSVIARDLLSKKQKVKVVVRDSAKGEPWSKQGAEVAVGDLDDQTFFTNALRGAKALFAMLPPPPLTTEDFYGAQRKMADSISGATKASGVPYVVMLSSVGAELSSGNGPIRGLHYLENALRNTGTKLVAIRAGFFQENVGSLIGAARDAGIYPNFSPSADTAIPMIATKDIGQLAAQCLVDQSPKSEIIDLHGPAYSPKEVAEKLGIALGKSIGVIDIPQQGWVNALTQAGLPQQFAEVYADMYAGFNSGTIRPTGDRAVQGKTTLDETIKTLIAKH